MTKRASSVEIEKYAAKVVGDDIGIVFARFGFKKALYKTLLKETEIQDDPEENRLMLEELRDSMKIRPDGYAIIEDLKAIICLEVEHKSLLTEDAILRYAYAWDYIDCDYGNWELFLIVSGRHGNWRQLPLLRKSHEAMMGKLSDEDHEFHNHWLDQEERDIKQVLAGKIPKSNQS